MKLIQISLLFVITFVQLERGSSSDNATEAVKEPVIKQGTPIRLPDGTIVFPYGRPSQGRYIYPRPPYRVPQNVFYRYPTPTAPPRPRLDRRLVAVLLYMLWISGRSNRATEAPPTVPAQAAPAGTCEWSPWSVCSAVCRGTRQRTRTCNGITQTDSETCNTIGGFLGDKKWYRAGNCYDYLLVTRNDTYQQAVIGCSSVGAQLASTGLRDNNVRTEVFTNVASGSHFKTYVGITDQAVPGVYEWSDGYIGYPTFWLAFQPNAANHRCHEVDIRNPSSLNDVPCSSTLHYLCERKA